MSKVPIRVPPPPVKERPCCLNCGKRLRPLMHQVTERVETKAPEYISMGVKIGGETGVHHRHVADEWRGEYQGGGGLFCKGACATEFGWSLGLAFLNGAESVRLRPEIEARLPALRAAREVRRNMKLARDVTS